MKTLIWSNCRVQNKDLTRGDHIFWSNGRVKMKGTNVEDPRKKTQKKEDHMFWSKCRVI